MSEFGPKDTSRAEYIEQERKRMYANPHHQFVHDTQDPQSHLQILTPYQAAQDELVAAAFLSRMSSRTD